METSQERTDKKPQRDTGTDVESTQSKQKKWQMKSFFLSDSDTEAIVEFIKQHEELYDKTHKFKDRWRKKGLWERLAASRNLSVNTLKKWFEALTRNGKLTKKKSGQAAEKITERQVWLRDSFKFLQGHIRRKGVSSTFKSPIRALESAATASVPHTSRENESEMEISLTSDVTHQQSTTSPSCIGTTGGQSTQYFWIVKSLWKQSKRTTVPADGHTKTIFTLSTSTCTITSVIFHTSGTIKASRPVQPAVSPNKQISLP